MTTGAAKKSPKQSHGGLVTSAPISSIEALRRLEKAYARQGEKLDAAMATIAKLEKEKRKK